MFMEILYPQGDPFTDPQVLLMNMLLQRGIIAALVKQMQPADAANDPVKARTYVFRLLLLLVVIMRFCSDLLPQNIAMEEVIESFD